MTSRTPVGVPQRPPQASQQRTLSSSSLSSQRPSQPRTFSQTFLPPSSPGRRESPIEIDSDGSEGPQVRPSILGRTGSRLRLELSQDIGSGHASMVESPQSMTPSRTVPVSVATDGGSPTPSRSSQPDNENSPMPMPPRQGPLPRHVRPARNPHLSSASVKKDARPKPYTVEVPADGPRLLSSRKHDPAGNRHETNSRDIFSFGLFSGVADFFPWHGNHHEDEWSSEAIQKGTWDKNCQSETTSARLAVVPVLKQKSGLNALSTIFMGVLNQRRHRGQITAPSTFKPPPRVTLTDTKREVWLKDLANPTISLRRLSRTIPHGIRGKTLLEQCLNKNVPTERAVWLAKCVGANEIRAFKRKGVSGAFAMGGESKWIRDWTVFVEQFVDSVASSFDDPNWRTKITYAIRLASHLYSEQLLDRDHYLDWVLAGLENSSHSRLPMWILIAKIYWADLLHVRKPGRRLVVALEAHLQLIHQDLDQDLLLPLSSQLGLLLKSLMQTHPESFVSPTPWMKYRDTLLAFISNGELAIKSAHSDLDRRNSRLTLNTASLPSAGNRNLVAILDSALKGSLGDSLTSQCWESCKDEAEMMRILVEWATSAHRPGLAKVYIAVNLIKTWKHQGIDPTIAVLGVSDDVAADDVIRKNLVYSFVNELVKSNAFSVSQYFQWLIARGGCRDESDIDPETGPCATRLLVELPTHCLPEKLRNERKNLLRRAGNYSVIAEEEDTAIAWKFVQHTLGSSVPDFVPTMERKPLPLRKLLLLLKRSNRGLKSYVATTLRDYLTDRIMSLASTNIAERLFTSVRAIMEAAEEYSLLADIVKSYLCVHHDVGLLTSLAATVDVHLPIFQAIGVANDLFAGLLELLKPSQNDRASTRPLCAALACLARQLPAHEDAAKQLEYELLQIDRVSAIDACSPVSDNMLFQGHSADAELADEVDKLLASGNSIDHTTMNRLFRNIVPRIETGWVKADDSVRTFASLLSRLRIFDTQHFDRIMADWISHVRSLTTRQPLINLFPLLITVECLSVATLLHTATAAQANVAGVGDTSNIGVYGSTTYLRELVYLLLENLPSTIPLDSAELYRFQIQQRVAKRSYARPFLTLIRNAILENDATNRHRNNLQDPLMVDPMRAVSVLDAMRELVVADSTIVSEVFDIKGSSAQAASLIQAVMTRLLLPHCGSDVGTSFDQILSLATELTLPFCQLKLNADLSIAQTKASEVEVEGPSQFDLFAKAMDRAIEVRNVMWTYLLPCLSEDITEHLKHQAHERFLDLIPSMKAGNLEDQVVNTYRIQLATNLLGVIEAIASGQSPSKTATFSSNLIEKLNDFWIIVGSKDSEVVKIRSTILDAWLPTLLRFIIIHSSTTDGQILGPPIPGTPAAIKNSVSVVHEARARVVLLLCGLLQELERLHYESTKSLASQVLDVAHLLVDTLPDETRMLCAKAVLQLPGTAPSISLTSDPRIFYLFSIHRSSRIDNLMVSHKDKASEPQMGSSKGMSILYGVGPPIQEKLVPFGLRRWELLSEPTPNIGENDTSLSLGLFDAIKIQ